MVQSLHREALFVHFFLFPFYYFCSLYTFLLSPSYLPPLFFFLSSFLHAFFHSSCLGCCNSLLTGFSDPTLAPKVCAQPCSQRDLFRSEVRSYPSSAKHPALASYFTPVQAKARAEATRSYKIQSSVYLQSLFLPYFSQTRQTHSQVSALLLDLPLISE